MNPLSKALLLMTLGMTFIPIGDALAKYINSLASLSPGFLAWSRFAFGVAFLFPFAIITGVFREIKTGFMFRQAIRGLLIALTLVFIISAVSMSPLAEVFGAFFIGPVFATVLSRLWLKEKVGIVGWIVVVLGFVGVLMVVKPTGEFSTGLYYALIAGVFYGGFLTTTRWAAHTGPPLAQLCAQMVYGFIFLLPLGALQISTTDWSATAASSTGQLALILVLVMGGTSAIANLVSILALKQASAAFLAPIVYLQVVVATIISWIFFKDTPDALALAGLVLIVFTGLMKVPQSLRAIK